MICHLSPSHCLSSSNSVIQGYLDFMKKVSLILIRTSLNFPYDLLNPKADDRNVCRVEKPLWDIQGLRVNLHCCCDAYQGNLGLLIVKSNVSLLNKAQIFK